MAIKFAKIANENVTETEIQKAFEENLDGLEEGLTYVGSFIPVGTGVIDVLAVDDDNNAVIMEFKRVGDFDEDALIQLMDYYSWFVSDENHQLYLKGLIQKVKPDFDSINDLRLIAIVSQVSDRVKNACWALEPSIKLITYSLFKDTNNALNIIPQVILDTSVGGEKIVRTPKTEEEHLKRRENLKKLYYTLKRKIMEINQNIRFNPSPQDYIGVVGTKTFLTMHFKPKWIRLDMLMKPKDVNDNPRIKDFPKSDWSYVHIESETDIDDELLSWIRLCYNKAA